MTPGRRQSVLLGVLAVVLTGAVAYRYQGRAPAAPLEVAVTTPGGAPPRTIPVTGINLDLLAARDVDVPAIRRNPFRFQPRTVVERVPQSSGTPAVSVAPPSPVAPPPPPPIPLKFIGLLDAPARVGRLAILSDSRGGVFYGKEGDLIEGQYRLLRVSDEAAELAYADGRGRQTIRLSGQ